MPRSSKSVPEKHDSYMGYMVCCALKEHRASPRSPQLLAVRTVPACCCCHSCFPISPWHLSGNVGVWEQDWGSEQKFLLVYLLKTLLLVFSHIFFYLCQHFSSVKSTYQAQQNLLAMQTPQIHSTPIELEGLDNLPAGLAHVLSQSMSTVRKKLSLPYPKSAKPLMAISTQALT